VLHGGVGAGAAVLQQRHQQEVMMVVTVLMMSCHVSTLPIAAIDGAQMTTSNTQKAKNGARLTVLVTTEAKRSNSPLSGVGISRSRRRTCRSGRT
jgi:hypothetical protein